ncbi:MAG TPA: superoxide dismutase [Phycisphaerales bacterium]|nr:superoxide dismutase [Phycisphaerales bacterium]
MKTRRAVQSITGMSTIVALGVLAWAISTFGHCQIPCGIYNDALRFKQLEEHFTTIEKSMKQIELLSKDPGGNANQLVRWIQNKEDHAQEIVEIITAYFLQQRIAPVETSDKNKGEAYVKQLTLCHKMLIAAMKTKQTTDLQHVQQLRSLCEEFKTTYFANEKQ